ncbi:hypothetical protein R2F25_31195 [Streptomyces sp. UP1A-1]|nr:hypothetical protein [Streptomyces sp. UP1A-1]
MTSIIAEALPGVERFSPPGSSPGREFAQAEVRPGGRERAPVR